MPGDSFSSTSTGWLPGLPKDKTGGCPSVVGADVLVTLGVAERVGLSEGGLVGLTLPVGCADFEDDGVTAGDADPVAVGLGVLAMDRIGVTELEKVGVCECVGEPVGVGDMPLLAAARESSSSATVVHEKTRGRIANRLSLWEH